MPRSMLLGLLAGLGMLGLAAAQDYGSPTGPAPLAPPHSDGQPCPLPQPDTQPTPYPLPHYPALPPQPVALPEELSGSATWQYVAPPVSPESAKDSVADKVQHLRQAADHLQAAGLTAQAAVLRKQAAEHELGSVVAEKLEQLKRLQAEIDQLCKPSQVKLEVKIVHVSRHKLRAAGGDVGIIGQVVERANDRVLALEGGSFTIATRGVGEADNAWAKLRKNGAIKVLAEPVMLTVSGRPASFWMGEERPILVPFGKDQSVVEFKKAGIQLDLLPVLMDDGHVRLEIRPRITTIDETDTVKIDGHSIPRIRTREIDTGVDIRLGQTLILACLAPEPAASKAVRQTSAMPAEKPEQEIVILVTPSLVSSDAPKATPLGPSAANR